MNNAIVDDLSNYFMKLQNLDMFTFQPAACPKPCTTMNIHVKTISAGYSLVSGSYMALWKSNQVYFRCSV